MGYHLQKHFTQIQIFGSFNSLYGIPGSSIPASDIIKLQTFNSLYGIHIQHLGYVKMVDSFNSLYGILVRDIAYKNSANVLLSIPFMGYINIALDSKANQYNTFNSLYGILQPEFDSRGLVYTPIFQFPLWDTKI